MLENKKKKNLEN